MKVGGASTQIVKLCRVLGNPNLRFSVMSQGGTLVAELKKTPYSFHKKIFMPVFGSKEQGETPVIDFYKYYRHLWRKFGVRGLFKSWQSLRKIILHIKKNDIDLIYANQPGPTTLAYFASKNTGIPFIFHVRGVLSNEFPPLFCKKVVNNAETILCESPELKQRLIHIYKIEPAKITIAEHIIDDKIFRPLNKKQIGNFAKKLGIGPDRKIITHISNLSAKKIAPVSALIDIAPILAKMADVQIIIAGDGPEWGKINARAEKINKRIGRKVLIVPGQIIDTPKLINISDMIVGTGTVFEEASLCQKPLILASHYGFGGLATYKTLELFKPTNLTGRGLNLPVVKKKMLESILGLIENPTISKKIVREQLKFINSYYGDTKKKYWALFEKMIGKKYKQRLIGLTRVKNEQEMMQEHLDHMAKFCDEIWVYDDQSDDQTAKIAENHPAVKVVLHTDSDWRPKKVGTVPDALELAKKTQRLLDEASKKSDANWFIYLDVDEFLDKDLVKNLPRLMKQNKYDALCFELYDFFITEKDKNKSYKGDIQTVRPYCGTEWRHQLFMWRNIPGLYYQEGVHREPIGFIKKRILYSSYKIKHYGKAKSVKDYNHKKEWYRKYRPQLMKSKFKFTLPPVRKDQSDLGKLVTWDQIKKNPKIKGALFYKYNPSERPMVRRQYQINLIKKRMLRGIRNLILGPNLAPSELKPEFTLKEDIKMIDQQNSMKKAYQSKVAVEDYERTRFSKPDRAVSHDKEVWIVNQVMAQEKPEKILDLALGPARVSGYIDQNLFKKGYGLDSSPAMLRIARKKLPSKKWKLIKGDAFKMPFKKEELDLVMTFRFIRHFKIKDRERLYKEIGRILKPNGVLILEAFNKKMGQYAINATGIGKSSAFARPVYDQLWSERGFKQELSKAGFRVERLMPVLNHFKGQHRLSKFAMILVNRFQINALSKLAKLIIRIWDWFPSQNAHQWEVICRKKE
jgi:ubiquinone/menaquinone biosynthesis C-methylase UbiE/UDP-N-acetylglucosamine:LPS N-acetylglucosamine transferase